jgi:hypothetical protein
MTAKQEAALVKARKARARKAAARAKVKAKEAAKALAREVAVREASTAEYTNHCALRLARIIRDGRRDIQRQREAW